VLVAAKDAPLRRGMNVLVRENYVVNTRFAPLKYLLETICAVSEDF